MSTWRASTRRVSIGLGRDGWGSFIHPPDGGEYAVSFEDVKTGDIKTRPAKEYGPGCVEQRLVNPTGATGKISNRARLIVASCNAIQAAAEKLGEDPTELAERLGNGHLADLIAIGEER